MPPELIRFTGRYRYRSPEERDRALVAARAELDDEDVVHPALATLRSFIAHSTTLHIDLAIPAIADVRFAAAHVVQTLARDAIEGSVEARQGAQHVDFFPSGEDD